MVLVRLIGGSDAVLMDLRGFSQQNAGCRYEIEELLNVAPLNRLMFVIDGTTDEALLERVASDGWKRLRAESPNRQQRRIKSSCSVLQDRAPASCGNSSPVSASPRQTKPALSKPALDKDY